MILKKYFSYIALGCILAAGFSCSNKNYPCPGLGKSDAADLSMFGEDGELKGQFKNKKRGRIDKNTGIVNKKNPKKIRKQRRTQI